MSDRAVHVLRSIPHVSSLKSGKSPDVTGPHSRHARVMKTASRALISSCGGGEGAAASISAATGRHARQQRMSACSSMHEGEFLRIDEVIALEDVAERTGAWPQVTRALATEHGFQLVSIRAGAVGGREIHGLLSALYRESGEAGAMVAEAIADGTLDLAEAEACLAEVDQMERAAADLRAALQSVIDAEGGQ